MEALPPELFGHVLNFLGDAGHRHVPACSTRSRQLWRMHANSEIRRFEKDFLYPFEFHQASTVTQRYYEIVGAVRRRRDDIVELEMLNVTRHSRLDLRIPEESVRETVNAIQNLLDQNPIRSIESKQLQAIDISLGRLLRFPSCWRMEDFAINSQAVTLILPMVEHVLLLRFKDFKNSVSYRNILKMLYFCQMKLSPPNIQSATELLQNLLAAEPENVWVLVQHGHQLLRLGQVEESFSMMKRALFMPFCDDQISGWATTVEISSSLASLSRAYGLRSVVHTLRQVRGHLPDIDPTDESLADNVSDRSIALSPHELRKAKDLVFQILDRVDNMDV